MKGVKGRILKRLNSIPNLPYYTKPLHPLLAYASENILFSGHVLRESNTIHVEASEFMTDTAGEHEEDGGELSNKENIIRPAPRKNSTEEETEAPPFRRPDPNSSTLFDPDLLAAFNRAVMEHLRSREEARSRIRTMATQDEPPTKILRREQEDEPLAEFEERCPPGGREAVILYTTSLRGIRKTFEDCRSVRFLLKSLRILFYERDVSMHLEFREELWRVLGGRAIPPRLFVRGRYIGGADEVLGLHEQGQLLPLARGLPADRTGGVACQGCGGIRFVVCSECSGSRRIYADEIVQCHECNENGLVVCHLCS